MVRNQKIVCSACRRRKSRCDGVSPSCGACVASNSACHYEKSPSVAYVRTLQARIRELEAKEGWESTNTPTTPSLVWSGYGNEDGDSVCLDALGDVSYHNGTSALHADPPRSLSEHSTTISLTSDESDTDYIRERLVASAVAQKRHESTSLDTVSSIINLPKDLVETLFKLHWCWLHPCFLFVYRPAFMRDISALAQENHPATYCSLALIKVICATSCRLMRGPETVWQSANSIETSKELTARVVSEARVLLAMETLNRPSISTIQGLLQQSARDVACGNSSSAWLYSGMAFRMAVDLGLHVSPDKLQQYSTTLTIEDIEIRKRLFWSLYAWDKLISLYLGRMPSFIMGAEKVSLEFLDDFTDQDPWVPFYGSAPKSGSLPPYPPTPGHVTSCFKELCKLCKILTRMMLELYNTHPIYSLELSSELRAASFVKIKKEFQGWYSSLPPFLCIPPENMPQLSPPPHITSLNLMYYTALILLHRPHVASGQVSLSAMAEQSRRTCQAATTAIYDLLNMYVATFGFHHITYMNSYCTYTAATTAVYLLQTSDDTSQSHDSRQTTWPELKFLLHILQHSASAIPSLNRSIDIIRAKIKRIFERQVSRKMDSLFQNLVSSRDRGSTLIGNDSCQSALFGFDTAMSSNATKTLSNSPILDWENDTQAEHLSCWDTWLPAFPAQDISYGSEVMLNIQDTLSPEMRSIIMGSNLDAQSQFNPSMPCVP